jgi:hypothetical protein
MEDLMAKSAKKQQTASTIAATAVGPAKSPQRITVGGKDGRANAGSKQSRVIAMLQSPVGTTIDSMMQATGWQQHSVRGFLAGVVRKRLKLKLESKKVDGTRVYLIAKAGDGRSKPRQGKRRPS